MDFIRLEKEVLDHYDDILEVHKLIRDTTGAKSVDILFYDDEMDGFFDPLNKVEFDIKSVGHQGIIGAVVSNPKSVFVHDIVNNSRYDPATDNPFNIEIDNQILIPIFDRKKLTGIIRLFQLPLGFGHSDFRKLVVLNKTFAKIFSSKPAVDMRDSNQRVIKTLKISNKIKNLFDELANNATIEESKKLINKKKKDLDDILYYLNSTTFKPEIDNTQTTKSSHHNALTVLVADDVKINVQILKATLKSFANIGEIKSAYDGEETLEVLEESYGDGKPIDIIFLDHYMPKALGSDIAREIREQDKYKDIIIVSITNDKEILKVYGELYDDHLSKPFKRENLDKVMKRLKDKISQL